jgi:hypothetical protein
MSRSRYDELHDKYDAILTTKSGTRYEHLAAMVFKALEESTAVIHDLSLLGESDVSHQIDVAHVAITWIELNGMARAAGHLCGDQSRAGADEWIIDRLAS